MKRICSLLLLVFLSDGCRKYLEKISDESLSVPNTVAGFRQILENDEIYTNSTPGLGQLGSDDIVADSTSWKNAEPVSHNAYIWAKDIFQGQTSLSWTRPYKAIYDCNVVLAGMPAPSGTDSAAWADYYYVWGWGLFLRAFFYYHLEETFGQPFRPVSADKDLGVILRLDAVPQQSVPRATVRRVYDQITTDLLQAIPLLPDGLQSGHRNRPCKPAAYALLSRVYLTMQDYVNSRRYADSCLRLYPALLDYNTLDTSSGRPFAVAGNEEVLFQCSAAAYQMQYYFTSEIDSVLYRSYDSNDLRRRLFFRQTPSGKAYYFKGGYTGRVYLFAGESTDLVYLDRAECNARLGEVTAAMADLNMLLAHRWKTGSFVPYKAVGADDALGQIIAQRRKETLFRECRWYDLRRLNQDPRFAVTLTRKLGDSVYRLLPNDPRYALPLPDLETRLSGVPQNQR